MGPGHERPSPGPASPWNAAADRHRPPGTARTAARCAPSAACFLALRARAQRRLGHHRADDPRAAEQGRQRRPRTRPAGPRPTRRASATSSKFSGDPERQQLGQPRRLARRIRRRAGHRPRWGSCHAPRRHVSRRRYRRRVTFPQSRVGLRLLPRRSSDARDHAWKEAVRRPTIRSRPSRSFEGGARRYGSSALGPDLLPPLGQEILGGSPRPAGQEPARELLGLGDYLVERADADLPAGQLDDHVPAALQPHCPAKLRRQAQAASPGDLGMNRFHDRRFRKDTSDTLCLMRQPWQARALRQVEPTSHAAQGRDCRRSPFPSNSVEPPGFCHGRSPTSHGRPCRRRDHVLPPRNATSPAGPGSRDYRSTTGRLRRARLPARRPATTPAHPGKTGERRAEQEDGAWDRGHDCSEAPRSHRDRRPLSSVTACHSRARRTRLVGIKIRSCT